MDIIDIIIKVCVAVVLLIAVVMLVYAAVVLIRENIEYDAFVRRWKARQDELKRKEAQDETEV